ncbi:phage tail sheath family protein [Collimonas arenae]|uniref:Phage tail sheath family protein n=1 Tax=Collimonas arenae TaxID=279058 RepID=A0A127PQH4_9BURK|nr:phage tail sheath C-terminal domain-containing protein [Collimonas arenae]AMP00060.1 phage tail sheath family protein [Collimonas arenae]AMP09956.1 phage tail sheath family protein [Collimonas arenae]
MANLKTPGVYVVEQNAFPHSVVEVATAVPAFIGCTQKAVRGNQSLLNEPTRIASFAEYVNLFGGPPDTKFAFSASANSVAITVDPATQYYFYASMRLFFDNGGGSCYIVSTGQFDQITIGGGMPAMSTANLCDTPLQMLLKEQEPTMLVVPDAVLLSLSGWQYTCQQMLKHCVTMQSRIAIFDVYDGYKARDHDDINDVISGANGFRGQINADGLNYGVAYYPWLNTSITEDSEVDYGCLSDNSKPAFIAALKAEAAANFPPSSEGIPDPKLLKLGTVIDMIALPETSTDPMQAKKDRASTHQALKTVSQLYQNVITEIQRQLNIVPPSGAMAGIYTRIDNALGVFNAPANVGINSVIKPTVSVTDDDQQDLNLPADGKAINAIRDFTGRGLVVWGARTLDGNSQDWKYINVRRTLIMFEQSIKIAIQAYTFEANDASTWITVNSMICNFLTSQWKIGALAGAKPQDAFSVNVGLGSTMTAEDILNGYMRITVMVAVTHPAEFIEMTFQQQMQSS